MAFFYEYDSFTKIKPKELCPVHQHKLLEESSFPVFILSNDRILSKNFMCKLWTLCQWIWKICQFYTMDSPVSRALKESHHPQLTFGLFIYKHTCICALLYTYIHAYIYMHIHMHLHTCTCQHVLAHACTYTHAHIQLYTYICMHLHTYGHTHTSSHTHAYTHVPAHTHAHIQLNIHRHTHASTHIHTYTCKCTFTHRHQHTQAPSHTCIHTCICTKHLNACATAHTQIFYYAHLSSRKQQMAWKKLRE